MKTSNPILLTLLVLLYLVIGCTTTSDDNVTPDDDKDKDKDPNTEVVTLTSKCKIDKVTRVEENNTNIITYHYDGDKITKITERNEGGSEDHSTTTVTYNAKGQYEKVEETSDWGQGMQVRRRYNFTYNAEGLISVVSETRYDHKEPYNSTTTMTYKDGKMASSISTGSDNMKATDMVYENGNLKSLKLDFNGDGKIVVETLVKCDDKFNHTKHELPTENMFDFYNNNNMLSVESVSEFKMGDRTVPAGSKLVDRTLTYDSNGEVTKMVDHPTIFDDNNNNRVKNFTYICQ